jgi:hypothetical protein
MKKHQLTMYCLILFFYVVAIVTIVLLTDNTESTLSSLLIKSETVDIDQCEVTTLHSDIKVINRPNIGGLIKDILSKILSH